MSTGLYNPKEFKDNCGFGLIAHLHGEPSHNLLQTAIESLTCMTHRGGIASDGKTGDGCGLLLQMPDTFMRKTAYDLFEEEMTEFFGVGMVFLSADEDRASRSRNILNQAIEDNGLELVGWREVPVDDSCLGPIAKDSLPRIEQVFVNSPGLRGEVLEARLLVARKTTMYAMRHDEDFYICSLSHRVVSYKGLMMPVDLPMFYSDLGDPTLETAICTFHQRFSTNTLPRWPLAQPFRFLAHNGEINTIDGNRNWAKARQNVLSTMLIPELQELEGVVNHTGSDSSSMDNMIELLALGGMDIFRAVRLIMPPAWQNDELMDPDLRAFYEYNSMHMEPWDGPAGMVMNTGRYAVCMLDRNGLRPSRWVITKDDYMVTASEIGTFQYAPEDVVAKGRVGPGEILAVDTQNGKILHTEDIDNQLKNAQPYKKWLRKSALHLEAELNEEQSFEDFSPEALKQHMKMYQVTFEERDQILRPLAELGQEAVGSMGDDTPMAVLSSRVRSTYDYFRQQFAQVTNPPIDPLREAVVMSLETCLGREQNIFQEGPELAKRVVLSTPILSASKYTNLLTFDQPGMRLHSININYDPVIGLEQAIKNVCQAAEQAVRKRKTIIILSDRDIAQGKLPIPAPMATGAVHHHLTEQGLRCDANIIVDTGSARDPHQFAVLIGFGATAVYPYLSYRVINDMVATGEMQGNPIAFHRAYRKGINKGLLKILSKMGISTVASYRGAQLFEAIGISSSIINLCFKGVASRIEGADFDDFQSDQSALAQYAWINRKPIQAGGLLKYIHGGEYHAFNPDVVQTIQKAVQLGDYNHYKDYAKLVNQREVATLRDLFKLSDTQPIDINQVEPATEIFKRFDSAAMSLGALSPEAHEALAMAMNDLGGRSNSGEGGEDPKRHGTNKRSKIKQIASGRFGVTPEYLISADVLQIKIAQGAKPGEGGQLPGGKVNELIANLRYSVPGVTLISPPPHHDIYSIEDLAQLIFDLKQVNPEALVSVKLVSRPGVGTIAAGVAKAYADLITISGYDGGTAASPLTSIHYAGSPWELGLAETHQTLRGNGLRGKVRVQTDGGLKTGLDIIKATILGAESYAFGTLPMVAVGCKYLRICHLNNCATGVATQNQQLRDQHFHGTVEMVKHLFTFIAEETREIMAQLGVRSLEELVGRTDLLSITSGATERQEKLDISSLLNIAGIDAQQPQTCQQTRNAPYDNAPLSERMFKDMEQAIIAGKGGEFAYDITNCDRSVGARISGVIAKHHGNKGMSDNPVVVKLKGIAGLSFGVWNAGGLDMYLEGDANDYVGKGMAGGKIIVYPPKGSTFKTNTTTILGNTCLYGATGGILMAAGQAGERFAVRNSGAHAVIEGSGNHCCEYMTGGVVTVLGETGVNFGAGMTGGFAYVLDMDRTFVDKFNPELIEIRRIRGESMGDHRSYLHQTITHHAEQTGSAWSHELSQHFEDYVAKFWLVKPKVANLHELIAATKSKPE